MTISEVGHFRKCFPKLGFSLIIIIIAGRNSAFSAIVGPGARSAPFCLCGSSAQARTRDKNYLILYIQMTELVLCCAARQHRAAGEIVSHREGKWQI